MSWKLRSGFHAANTNPSDAPAEKSSTLSNDDGSMIAVYVDTTADRVTKSLEELRSDTMCSGFACSRRSPWLAWQTTNVEPRTDVVSESLLREELEDVTSAYITNQQLAMQSRLTRTPRLTP